MNEVEKKSCTPQNLQQGGITTNQEEKISRLIDKIDLYASEGRVRSISREDVRSALADASREWGRLVTSEPTKRSYVRTLIELRVLEPAREPGSYVYHEDMARVSGAPVPTNARLTDAQARAVRLLASGSTDIEAGREVGVDRTTVYRWRTSNRHFRAELQAARDAQIKTVAQAAPEMTAPESEE